MKKLLSVIFSAAMAVSLVACGNNSTAEISAQSVEVPEKLELALGGEGEEIKATVNPKEAKGYSIRYESTNDEVATVDENGKVTAVGEGECIVQTIVYAEDKEEAAEVNSEAAESEVAESAAESEAVESEAAASEVVKEKAVEGETVLAVGKTRVIVTPAEGVTLTKSESAKTTKNTDKKDAAKQETKANTAAPAATSAAPTATPAPAATNTSSNNKGSSSNGGSSSGGSSSNKPSSGSSNPAPAPAPAPDPAPVTPDPAPVVPQPEAPAPEPEAPAPEPSNPEPSNPDPEPDPLPPGSNRPDGSDMITGGGTTEGDAGKGEIIE